MIKKFFLNKSFLKGVIFVIIYAVSLIIIYFGIKFLAMEILPFLFFVIFITGTLIFLCSSFYLNKDIKNLVRQTMPLRDGNLQVFIADKKLLSNTGEVGALANSIHITCVFMRNILKKNLKKHRGK